VVQEGRTGEVVHQGARPAWNAGINAVAVDATGVYWAQVLPNESLLMRLPRSKGMPTTVAEASYNMTSVALGARGIYVMQLRRHRRRRGLHR
jgi:hypothetical protein